MKANELRQLAPAEIELKEKEMREQIFRLRFQLAMGQTDGLKKYRAVRKDLARLLTVRRENESAQAEA